MGVHDVDYPRNRFLRAELAKIGSVNVLTRADLTSGPLILRAWRLFRERPTADVVVLSEFANTFILWAWAMAKLSRAILVVDIFVGLSETRLGDHALHRRLSPHAFYYWVLDTLVANLGDICITDTSTRQHHFARKSLLRRRQVWLWIPVGAPSSWRRHIRTSDPPNRSDRLKLLFYGSYLPLHGVERFLRKFEEPAKMGLVQLLMVGDGPCRAAAEEAVKGLQIQNCVTFRDAVSEHELPALINDSDAILGSFGESDKARSVIPHKVWQALALGRPVITQRTDALRDLPPSLRALVLADDADPPGFPRLRTFLATLGTPDPASCFEEMERTRAIQTRILLHLIVQSEPA